LIAVSPHPDGSLLPVLAQPGAKRNAVLGERAGALRVAVTSPAEKGKANEEIQRLMTEALGCRPSHVSLISGKTSRKKLFLVRGLNPAELSGRLALTLAQSESPASSEAHSARPGTKPNPR
jgi:uncharacterized protein